MIFVICRKFELEFPQVVWQHTLGVVGYIVWVLFTFLLLCLMVKVF